MGYKLLRHYKERAKREQLKESSTYIRQLYSSVPLMQSLIPSHTLFAVTVSAVEGTARCAVFVLLIQFSLCVLYRSSLASNTEEHKQQAKFSLLLSLNCCETRQRQPTLFCPQRLCACALRRVSPAAAAAAAAGGHGSPAGPPRDLCFQAAQLVCTLVNVRLSNSETVYK